MGNSKDMNAIFLAVDDSKFKLISKFEVGKEAWDTVLVSHVGADKVTAQRLRVVNTRFENLNMKEDETIVEFNAIIYDISTKVFALGEPIKDARLVSKVLRSIPERFEMKVIIV